MFTQILEQAINNAVYEWVKRAGGLWVFREGSDAVWMAAKQGIVSRLDTELRMFRDDVDQTWYGDLSSYVWRSKHWDLLCQTDGETHREFEKTLRRISSKIRVA
jgi:hypothetical protein